MFDILYNFELSMNKTIILFIFLLLTMITISCKTLKKNNCDCPKFGKDYVNQSQINS